MICVLHVVESFDGQAAESWLARLLNFDGFDAELLHFDFFLTGSTRGKQVRPVLERGCTVQVGSCGTSSIPQIARALRQHVRAGNYDIVHIHQDVLSGVLAFALAGTGLKVVTHVHNCWQRLPVGGTRKEQILTAIARQLTLSLSDAIVGVSQQALDKMTGGIDRQNRLDRVIYCSAKMPAIALGEADRVEIAAEVRQQYGLPSSTKLLLFLGRLDEYKNPVFALDVLIKMVEEGNREVCLMVAGVGGLEQHLRELAAKHGVAERVRILGWIDDPARLLLASDLLLMPSQEWCGEGLGLAAVEAQGCGVPVLCSQSIPADAAIVSGLFRRISLRCGAEKWAEVARELLAQGKQELAASRVRLEQSPFTNAASYAALVELYSNLASVRPPTSAR